MRKKKLLIAIVALILIAFVGTTFAYFQSSTSFINEFNTNKYKVITKEVFSSPDNWIPGEEIPKTLVAKNKGTMDSAVRVSYVEKWEDSEGNDITNEMNKGDVIINFDNQSDWEKVGNYYYYRYILEPEEQTTSFIKSVTLNPNLGDETICTTSQDGTTTSCKSATPSIGGKYFLTVTIENVQYDKYKTIWNTSYIIADKPISGITYLNKQNTDRITIGDEIGLGDTEDFYVISTNSEKTVLLAKYNLLIGTKKNADGSLSTFTPDEPGYGLQSVDMVGYNNGKDEGKIKFSDTNYWMDGTTIKEKYNSEDLLYLYKQNPSNDYWWRLKYKSDNSQGNTYVYDENSIIYDYISGPEGYVRKLIDMGAPGSITGRLISIEEIKKLGCEDEEECPYDFIFGRPYWTGSAYSHKGIYGVNGSISMLSEYNYPDCVRPIIEIPTESLQ